VFGCVVFNEVRYVPQSPSPSFSGGKKPNFEN
jgi:hypothetical protein